MGRNNDDLNSIPPDDSEEYPGNSYPGGGGLYDFFQWLNDVENGVQPIPEPNPGEDESAFYFNDGEVEISAKAMDWGEFVEWIQQQPQNDAVHGWLFIGAEDAEAFRAHMDETFPGGFAEFMRQSLADMPQQPGEQDSLDQGEPDNQATIKFASDWESYVTSARLVGPDEDDETPPDTETWENEGGKHRAHWAGSHSFKATLTFGKSELNEPERPLPEVFSEYAAVIAIAFGREAGSYNAWGFDYSDPFIWITYRSGWLELRYKTERGGGWNRGLYVSDMRTIFNHPEIWGRRVHQLVQFIGRCALDISKC